MERMTTRLLRHNKRIDHFYSTPEYKKHKHIFDFYKKNRTDLCNFVGFRDDCPISLVFWDWYLMVTKEFEKFYLSRGQYKEKVFNFLDGLKDPYKHIFYPVWEINTYVFEKGYYPYQIKGVDKITMFVASEYAKYKVSQKINDYGNKAQ